MCSEEDSSHSGSLLLDSSPSSQPVNEASKNLFKSIRLSEKKQHPPTKYKTVDTYRELSKDEDTHSWIDELHFMYVDKAVVLSGDWINVAIINANQYNIEQVVQTKFQDVGY